MQFAHPRPLFRPLQLGALALQHRIVLSGAPLCALRADIADPYRRLALYYGERATRGGLVVCGAALFSAGHHVASIEPSPWTAKQVNEWRRITDVIHHAGGLCVLQLTGPNSTSPGSKTLIDLDEVLDDYRTLADNANDAGFDGVEVLCPAPAVLSTAPAARPEGLETSTFATSKRFLIDALLTVISTCPAARVGVCFAHMAGSCVQADPADMVETLTALGVAFVRFEPEQSSGARAPAETFCRALKTFGIGVIASGPWTYSGASLAVQRNEVDAIAPEKFIRQGDLPARWNS